MSTTAIYVSGPMTGLPDNNFPAFNEATEALRAAGYEVVNPAELDAEGGCEGWAWADYLRRDLAAMMKSCDKIAHIDGWLASKGARLEHDVAEELGWPIKTVAAWLAETKLPLTV